MITTIFSSILNRQHIYNRFNSVEPFLGVG